MTYSLSNNCTKNYNNRTLTVHVIVEDVVTWIFFETQCSLFSGIQQALGVGTDVCAFCRFLTLLQQALWTA